MPIKKFTGPDDTGVSGFVVVDLAEATAADGQVRCAKKILMDGAWTMARSRTYAWALLGQRRSGASAAVNAAPPARHHGIQAFLDAVVDDVSSGSLSFDAGKGIATEELGALEDVDARSEVRRTSRSAGTLADELVARSATSAAATALGDLSGRTVAIEGAASSLHTIVPLIELVATAGATLVAVGTPSGTLVDTGGLDPTSTASSWAEHGDSMPAALGSDLDPQHVLSVRADVLFCGSRLGMVDHDVAASLQAEVLVPIGVAPVTAKGLAVATRAGTTVLADFLTTSGSLHSFVAPSVTEPEELVRTAVQSTAELTIAALAHPDGAYLGACHAAEQFLTTWVDQLPFGRPLA